jgi:hypothetical protein
MLAREEDAVGHLERAHRLNIERGEQFRAIHCAIWTCLILFTRGEIGPASGWVARAERLLEKEQDDDGQRGYLLIPRMFQQEAEGDMAGAVWARRNCGYRPRGSASVTPISGRGRRRASLGLRRHRYCRSPDRAHRLRVHRDLGSSGRFTGASGATHIVGVVEGGVADFTEEGSIT